MTDKKTILEWYQKGFHDELWGTSSTLPENDEVVRRAYSLGADHAIIGDDVRSVDYLSNDEIYKMIIKDEYNV